jgi:ATP-binding cassette, subfamily C, bacterial CydCD
MKLDRRLLEEARAVRLYLALTVGAGVVAGVVIVLQAYLLSLTVSQVFLEGRSLEQVQPLLLGLLLLISARAALTWVRDSYAIQAAGRIKAALRERLLARLLDLGPARVQGERTGELVSTAVEGIEALDAYFSQYLPSLALAALIPVTILLFVFPLDAISGLLFLVTAPLIPFFMMLIGKSAEGLTRRQWDSLSRMSAHFLDTLQGLPTLKALGISAAQAGHIERVSDRFRHATMGVLRVAFLSALMLELLATISTALVAVQVGFRLLYDTISFQQAFFVLILAPEFYQPLRALGASFHAGTSAATAARRIFELLGSGRGGETGVEPRRHEDTKGTVSTHHASRFTHHAVPSLAVEEVSFRYGREEPAVLEDLSFHLPAGRHLALVGVSGAGKSTLAHLLLRFLEPGGGRILVDGTPLGEIPPEGWRERSAWVPQHPYLFNDTIADNIRIGRPRAGMEEIVRAATDAGIHPFVEQLPLGYDTPIGERGVRLSGGQAQRVALARAFLKDAPILILDEASSHLDPWQEVELRESIERLMAGRTVITIAHRLGSVRRADRIVVLAGGRVEQEGTHEELLGREGLYRRLVAAQGEDAGVGGRGDAGTGPVALSPSSVTLSPSSVTLSGAKGLSGGGWAPGQSATGEMLRCAQHDRAGGAQHDNPAAQHSALSTHHSSWGVFRRLLRTVLPFAGWALLSALLAFATVASGIGLMATAAFLLATAATHPSVAELVLPVVGVRFFGISRAALRYLERYVSHDVTFRLLARWRVWFYQAVEPLAPARLMTYRSGDLLARVVADVETLQHFYIRVAVPPLAALMVAILVVGFMAAFDGTLALVLLLFLLLAGAGLPPPSHRLTGRASAREVELRSSLNERLVDGIQGMADLMAFGQGRRQLERLQVANREWLAEQQRGAKVAGMHGAATSALSHLAMWTVLAMAIPMVSAGRLEGVLLPVLALAALASFEAVAPLPHAFQHLGGSLASARRLFEIVDAGGTEARRHEGTKGTGRGGEGETEGRGDAEAGSVTLSEAKGLPGGGLTPARASTEEMLRSAQHDRSVPAQSSVLSPQSSLPIAVEGLSFRYGPGEPLALEEVSFQVPAGGRVAIVGPSGAGKSTLFNLLLRFWEYQEGLILLGGRELRTWNPDELRRLVAVVSQRTHLFNGSLRQNILLASPRATEEEMVRAAEAAQLHAFVQSLPRGYDTQVGEQGLRLSGGERQRVSIARALLRNSPVLLLDEPTAGLDGLTERRVMEAVLELMGGRTTLFITHRLSHLETMDDILVLEAGRIAERGRQRELLGRSGIYRRMWEAQHHVLAADLPEQPSGTSLHSPTSRLTSYNHIQR